MSAGSSTAAAAVPVDVGGTNTFTRTDSAVGAGQPYWPAWWTFTPDTDGYLVLDTSDTEGTGLVDTMLNIRRDSSANAPFAGDDDSGDGPAGRASRIAVDVFAGVAYWIKVGSFSTDGDGITVYHLSAAFTEVPALPNPRTFTIPGGSLTDPGLVMGPTVVETPRMPPLSISRPTLGLPDATFIFDATTWLTDLGVPSAWIGFDGMLSYLSSGQCDTAAPEVGLNLFHVNHALPFTWEEDWDTDFIGQNTGVDGYGRAVPRGQSTWFVETGKTYIIQLTTPPGNDVRFILRVSDFGQHTGTITIPDQTWRVSNDPWDDGAGDPQTYGPLTIPWAKNNDDSFGPVSVDAQFPAWSLATSFHGAKQINAAFGGEDPAASLSAAACSWSHSRRGKAPGDSWSFNYAADGAPPPRCRPLSDHESGDFTPSDGRVGFTYESDAPLPLIPSFARYDVYDSQFRLRASDLLDRFDAFAGVAPTFDAPDGYTNTSPIFSGPTGGTPELLGVQIAMDQLDTGTLAASPTRMFVQAASYDNDDGSSDPWGPAEDSSTTEHWRGTVAGPEQYVEAGHLEFAGDLVDLPLDDVWADALDDEARADDSGGPTYHGSLRVVGLFNDQLLDVLPTPAPAGVVGETINNLATYQFPVLFLELRPTVTYRFADYPTVPVAVVSGGPIRLLPRGDEDGIFSSPRMWPPPKSGARLFGAEP